MAIKSEAVSALDRIKQLDDERNRLMEEARSEALGRAQDAVSALNDLGLNYRLAQRGGKAAPSRRGTRQANPDRPCPICGFRTHPPHDARAHRSQDPKKPFTAAELQQRGLSKV